MYELVGFQFVDIPAKGDDRAIRGHSCWFLVDENDPKFTGRSAVKVFFSDEGYAPFTKAMLEDLIRPDVTYKDYVDLVANINLDYMLQSNGIK